MYRMYYISPWQTYRVSHKMFALCFCCNLCLLSKLIKKVIHVRKFLRILIMLSIYRVIVLWDILYFKSINKYL